MPLSLPYTPPRIPLTQQGIEPNPGPKGRRSGKGKGSKKGGGKRTRKVRIQSPNKPAPTRRKKHSLLGAAGGIVGGYLGGPIGSRIGTAAGNFISHVTGMGAYQVKTNALMSGDGRPPSFGMQTVVVQHSEFLGNVTGSTDFTISEYPVQPGLPSSMPWLSQIAKNFDKYRLLGALYEFRTTSGYVAGPDTALGSVLLATQYDTYNPPFANKQQMEAYLFCTQTPPYQSALHPLECSPAERITENYFVRTGDVPFGADRRLFDTGTFYIATEGTPENVLGELWVTYKVEFRVPKLDLLAPETQFLTNHFFDDGTSWISEPTVFYGLSSSECVDPMIHFNGVGGDISMVFPGVGAPARYIITIWQEATNPVTIVGTGSFSGPGITGIGLFDHQAQAQRSVLNTPVATRQIALTYCFEVDANGGELLCDWVIDEPSRPPGYAVDVVLTRVSTCLGNPPLTLAERLEEVEKAMRGERKETRVTPQLVEPKLRGKGPLFSVPPPSPTDEKEFVIEDYAANHLAKTVAEIRRRGLPKPALVRSGPPQPSSRLRKEPAKLRV